MVARRLSVTDTPSPISTSVHARRPVLYGPQEVSPGIMVTMNADWVTIAGYENRRGCLQPLAAVRA